MKRYNSKDALAPTLPIGQDSTFWKQHNASEPKEPCHEHLSIQSSLEAILPNVLRLHMVGGLAKKQDGTKVHNVLGRATTQRL
jgi:hypothetical protein